MTDRNTALFDRIADAIEAHPEQYDQNVWVYVEEDWKDGDDRFQLLLENRCGTRACVAGWAIALGRSGRPATELVGDMEDQAASLLGLTEEEGESLFMAYWDAPSGETVPEALRRIGRGGDITND